MISTELLRRYTFFGQFTDRQLRTLARLSSEMEFKAGSILFRPGERLESFYLLTHGVVSLYLCVPDHVVESPSVGAQVLGDIQAERIPIDSVTAGQVFCWSALVPPFESTAGAIVSSNAECVRFEAAPLLKVFEEDPGFGYLMLRKLAGVIHERLHNRRMEDLWSLT